MRNKTQKASIDAQVTPANLDETDQECCQLAFNLIHQFQIIFFPRKNLIFTATKSVLLYFFV